jgi:ABC-type glycerol-3-phosphate transport system permease component
MSTTITKTIVVESRHNQLPKLQRIAGRFLLYLLITGLGAVFFTPFFWLVSSSLKKGDQIFDQPVQWWPQTPQWHNYVDAWNALPFTRYLYNTLFVTILPVVVGTLVAALVAYGFARFTFPGHNFLFMAMLATMFLPFTVTIIPSFLIWKTFGLIDTYDPLVFPALFGDAPLFIFLMRQFFLTVPKEIEEAATIDGANVYQMFVLVMLPLIRPALLAVGIISFQGHWNDFLLPLIYLNTQAKYTMTIGMYFFTGGVNERPHWEWLMAMSTVMLLPILLLFIVFQRFFIEGLMAGSVKG